MICTADGFVNCISLKVEAELKVFSNLMVVLCYTSELM